MTEQDDPIQETVDGVSPEETPNAAEEVVTQNVTPSEPSVDVDALKAEYESKLEKYQRDLNQMKSSLQRREAEVTREWQSRYKDLEQKMHEARMASMTDDERARYERQLENEEYQALRHELENLRAEKALLVETINARDFFIRQGIPADKLPPISEGYQAISEAGWRLMSEELAQLRELAKNPPRPAEPRKLKEAPRVVTDKGTPASGTTWDALRKRFGSDEAVYRAIEDGSLDPSVLPS